MTPQEIAARAASVNERMLAFVQQRMKAEDEAINAERTAVQALCAEHVGHVWGKDPNALMFPSSGPTRYCVLCQLHEKVPSAAKAQPS